MSKLFLISFSFLLATSCHPLFCGWDSDYSVVKIHPDPKSLPGLYSLTGPSRKYLGDKGYNVDSCKLELRNDGLFVMTKSPGIVFNPFGASDTTYHTRKGRWFVSCDASDGCLMELEGICVEPFLEKDHKLAISKTIGDGDECEGIIFEKVK
jgi:hypothetical protein